jgi:hypothetical protein
LHPRNDMKPKLASGSCYFATVAFVGRARAKSNGVRLGRKPTLT